MEKTYYAEIQQAKPQTEMHAWYIRIIGDMCLSVFRLAYTTFYNVRNDSTRKSENGRGGKLSAIFQNVLC